VARKSWLLFLTVTRLPQCLLMAVVGAWRHRFRDTRVILECEGDLHYYQVSGRLQQVGVRTGIVVATCAGLFVSVLLLNNVRVAIANAYLERTQAETYRELVELGAATGVAVASGTEGPSVVDLTGQIRDRQALLVQLIGTMAEVVSDDNERLSAALASSGIPQSAVARLSQGAASGGRFAESPEMAGEMALKFEVPDKLLLNHELKSVLRALPTRMPLTNYAVTSCFGFRRHPILNKPAMHTGVDLRSQTGDDVVTAPAAGVVHSAGWDGGYGNTIVVDHGGGVQTLYGHLAVIQVKKGQMVKSGASLGRVGSTGLSTGKHLHFEVIADGRPLNPEKVVRAASNVQ
jgi:murein DD-endopeptidase MepM/ murein hydrolase activator NlpD